VLYRRCLRLVLHNAASTYCNTLLLCLDLKSQDYSLSALTMAVSEIVGKVRGALQRRDSSSSSSSSDIAPSPPSSPGSKQEGRERHAKLAQSLQATVDNSAKPESADSNTSTYIHDPIAPSIPIFGHGIDSILIVVHNSAIAPATTATKYAWIRDMFSEEELESVCTYFIWPLKLNSFIDSYLQLSTWVSRNIGWSFHYAEHKPGNYVIDRKTKEKKFEDMPIYVRIGMHLLFNQSYLSVSITCSGLFVCLICGSECLGG
jgi:hypothetical protein